MTFYLYKLIFFQLKRKKNLQNEFTIGLRFGPLAWWFESERWTEASTSAPRLVRHFEIAKVGKFTLFKVVLFNRIAQRAPGQEPKFTVAATQNRITGFTGLLCSRVRKRWTRFTMANFIRRSLRYFSTVNLWALIVTILKIKTHKNLRWWSWPSGIWILSEERVLGRESNVLGRLYQTWAAGWRGGDQHSNQWYYLQVYRVSGTFEICERQTLHCLKIQVYLV